jgi:hypothetical protein
MYQDKKVSLTIISCKRINLLRRVLKAFYVFCADLDVIDEIVFFDDSSTVEEKKEMEYLLEVYFSNKKKIITHFDSNSFPDNYRHARILNHWRNILLETNTDYSFLLEDDYLFVDFFKISEAISALKLKEEYAYFSYAQSLKKFPSDIKIVEYDSYWEWYYDSNKPINCNLFVDDVATMQSLIPTKGFWLTYINWASFSLRPGVHDVKKLLSIGEFSTTYDTKKLKVELEFALRWSKKYKTLCHKRFHIINLGYDESTSAYTLNNSK